MSAWTIVVWCLLFLTVALWIVRTILEQRRRRREAQGFSGVLSSLRGRVDELEKEVNELRRLSSDIRTILPKDAQVMSLSDRLERIGFSFEEDDDPWSYKDLPDPLKESFTPSVKFEGEEGYKSEYTAAVCSSCIGWWPNVVETKLSLLHPGHSIGLFCDNCGKGRLFVEVNNLRKAAGLPELPDGQLMDVINALEAEAKRLYPQAPEPPAPDGRQGPFRS